MLRVGFVFFGVFTVVVAACGPVDIGDQGERFRDPQDPSPDDDGPSDPFPEDDPTCPGAAAVVTASNGWQNVTASEPAISSLQLSLLARPQGPALDALVAVGADAIADFSDAVISVRFSDDGLLDVRDGAEYSRDTDLVYEPGVWHEITIYANVDAQTYDVEVARCGDAPQTLITGAAFRSDANAVDALTTWAVWSSEDTELEVATPSWVGSGGCAPATCESLELECGAPQDGCGGRLSCGSCGADEACDAGTCMQVSPPPPPSDGGGSGGTPGDDGGGVPGGLEDDCPVNRALSGACVCGGSVYGSGYCCDGGYSYSACSTRARYVLPGGKGANDGSDWSNALDGLPGVLARDTTYWLGAGSYGRYTFDDAASGQKGITLRKATAQEHGTDSGWSAAYGNGQAVFGPLEFSADRYTVDGGEPNGIKTVGQMGTKATVRVTGSHLVLRHVEIDGGLKTSGGKQTAGSCNGSDVMGDYVVFDRCEVHNIADDGIGIYWSDHIKVLYSKIHALRACGTDAPCEGPCYNGHSDGFELNDITDIELIGNMVYDVQSTAALFMSAGAGVRDLVAYNNVFYTPDTGLTVYLRELHGAKFHNNVIWGKTQGSRYGGLSIGQGVTDLEMYNNIILNINYSHMGASQNRTEHDLDYNLFGMIDSGQYQANTNDVVADPQFAGIPQSSNGADHKRSGLTLEDFVPTAPEAIDTGTDSGAVPAYDILGNERPQGQAVDRGVLEVSR